MSPLSDLTDAELSDWFLDRKHTPGYEFDDNELEAWYSENARREQERDEIAQEPEVTKSLFATIQRAKEKAEGATTVIIPKTK